MSAGLVEPEPLVIRVRLDVLSDDDLYVDAAGNPLGVFHSTLLAIEPGAPVSLEIALPWGETLSCSAVVDWRRERSSVSFRGQPGIGVRLESISNEHARLLQHVLVLRPPVVRPAGRR